MEYLIHSSGAQPIEKTIKIHELKTKYEKKYCLWFQNGSCRFGKACKKLHEIDPDYKKKIPEEKKEINNDKKRNPTKFQKKQFVPNNFNNKIAGAPKYSPLMGQPPQYSTKQINALQIYYEVNNLEISPSEQDLKMPANVHPVQNKNSWIFSGAPNSPDPSQARLCVFQQSNAVTTTMEIDTSHIYDYSINLNHTAHEDVRIHDITIAWQICDEACLYPDAHQKSSFKIKHFLIENLLPLAPESSESFKAFSLCVLGWAPTNDEFKFPRDIAENSHQFMTLCYNLGKYWLQSYVILPDKQEYIQDSKNWYRSEDFMNFNISTTRYHPPGAPGSYVSRFTSHTSHMKLIVRLRQDKEDRRTPFLFCAILLDFMAYISYVISKEYHEYGNYCDISIIRSQVTREITWASKFIPDFTQGDLLILTTIINSVYVMPKLTKALNPPACNISVNDGEMKVDKVSKYMKCPSLPPTVDGSAIANYMPPILTSPSAILVDRLLTSIRAPVFNNGSINPRRSRTLRIPHSEIQHSWKDLTRQQQEKRRYRSFSSSKQSKVPPNADPDNVRIPQWGTVYTTPTKTPRILTFKASRMLHIAGATQSHSKIILDSGAGISGVGQSWKMTDISKTSSLSIQGAFGDSIKPSLQGLLGSDKLHAVLVPGMKDDIYSLSSLLQKNPHTGAKEKIAIFTANGAIVLTAESCQGLIQRALNDGHQTHAADQIDGIYVLRNHQETSMKLISASSNNAVFATSSDDHNDGLYAGYTVPGLS